MINGHVINSTMGRMEFVIDDSIEKEFREGVFNRLGMKKGNLSIAVEKAIRQWLNDGK